MNITTIHIDHEFVDTVFILNWCNKIIALQYRIFQLLLD